MWKRILLVMIAVTVASGQTAAPRKPFVASEYPAEKFRVSKNDYPMGAATVRVIDVKNIGDGEHKDTPHFCSAWVEVLKGEQLVKRLYYEDIEPVGFSFGAFVPQQQLAPEYFTVVKEGDYDGRLLLIEKDGSVVNLPGGFYFVTSDQKFLISEYAADVSEWTVFDLANHRILLQAKNLPDIDSWYRDKSGYFFVEAGRPEHAQRLDLENGQFVKFGLSANSLKTATKVRYDFDPRKKEDCTSVQQ